MKLVMPMLNGHCDIISDSLLEFRSQQCSMEIVARWICILEKLSEIKEAKFVFNVGCIWCKFSIISHNGSGIVVNRLRSVDTKEAPDPCLSFENIPNDTNSYQLKSVVLIDRAKWRIGAFEAHNRLTNEKQSKWPIITELHSIWINLM